jgi:hypothetical protein
MERRRPRLRIGLTLSFPRLTSPRLRHGKRAGNPEKNGAQSRSERDCGLSRHLAVIPANAGIHVFVWSVDPRRGRRRWESRKMAQNAASVLDNGVGLRRMIHLMGGRAARL